MAQAVKLPKPRDEAPDNRKDPTDRNRARLGRAIRK
jgi:hypothetical protein